MIQQQGVRHDERVQQSRRFVRWTRALRWKLFAYSIRAWMGAQLTRNALCALAIYRINGDNS